MAYATARPMQPDSIPVIDISPLSNGTDPQSVADALQAASTGLGFIYIKGHGIPDEVISAARATAFQFFKSTEAEKSSVLVSSKHRGWLKPGAAKMGDDAKADLKESFIWGHQDSAGHTDEDHPLRGKNQWPEFLPGMDQIAMSYFSYAHKVAFDLMRGFAIGLGLPENFFLLTADRPLSRASYVYYPAQDESCGE
jgi:isopenicillin N synthase-like dioxygenase